MFGKLRIEKNGDGSWFDCSHSVQPIPEDFADDDDYLLHSTARQKRSLGGATPISFQAAGCLGNKWERALGNICMRV